MLLIEEDGLNVGLTYDGLDVEDNGLDVLLIETGSKLEEDGLKDGFVNIGLKVVVDGLVGSVLLGKCENDVGAKELRVLEIVEE